jgi:CelD/BcsL family acetyltransferase involved in cellulose biosynthesis
MSESVASRADVEILRSIPDHEALAREWTALWQRSPNATTFQRPEWLLAWLHLFQPESLWSVVLRRGSRLVGLVPLFVEEGVLFPIGAGVTDYLDGLFDQSEPDAAAAFADFLRSGGEWESLDFEQLRPGSPLLSESLFAGLQREVIAENCSPVLQLPASRDLREVVSSGMLKNLRYARRQLEKAGRVEWLVADESNLGELLDALFRTHASRWEMKGESGMLAGDEIQSMHREVAAGLLKRGVLRLYGLRLEGRLVGALESFFEAGTAYFYLHGFEPEIARFSPGAQLVGRFIEDAVERGVRTVDFLRGQEPYKYRWGAKDMQTYRLRLRRL